MSKTNIPWADAVWNPITGCTKCSPGCVNCYAVAMTKRLTGMGVPKYRDGFAVRCHEHCLTEPLKWRKPRTIFVCSMSDLFHPDVPEAFLDRVFAVMALCQQHTFVLCTKRAERMREYLTAPRVVLNVLKAVTAQRALTPNYDWPLPNVHLGVTVESHEQHERINILKDCPASHRWVSYEPALGELNIPDFTSVCPSCYGSTWPGDGHAECDTCRGGGEVRTIDALVIGCESGPNRRPFDLAWARQVRDDCEAAGVLFYVKQLIADGRFTKDVEEFPEDLRSQELPWNLKAR